MPAADGLVTAFVMTQKGFAFLSAALDRHRDLFRSVVVGADAALTRDYEREILDLCRAHNVPASRRSDAAPIRTEYALAVSWRWLIAHPVDKLIVFHDALLPRYRGFAPLPSALINGEEEIGVTALFGASEYDRGPILAQSSQRISYPMKIARAIELVTQNYVEAGMEVLERLSAGQVLHGTPQDEARATYSLWRDEQDYEINWHSSAAAIRRFIDALGDPYQGARTTVSGVRCIVNDAVEVPDVKIELRDVGKVVFVDDGRPVVVCGTGLLKIVSMALEDGTSALPLPRFRSRFGLG